MTPKQFLNSVFCAFVFAPSISYAASIETLVLKRTIEAPNEVQGTLARDEYRKEPYQAEYKVQIPYQTTESYIEMVPYTEQVAYTETETYYDQEYRCETRTDWERDCTTERVCQTEPPGQKCYEDIYCPPGYGMGDVVGCERKQVCSDIPGVERCENVQRCENRPITREHCGWQSVPRQREVTKYRDETKWREETRYREVTRYRTETRCCRTEYRDVFDHQWTLPVTVRFPSEATLIGNEVESFLIKLTGSEAEPDAELTAQDTIFGYSIKNKDVKPGSALFEMELVPKFSQAKAGPGSVSKPVLEVSGIGVARVRFTDSIRHSRVTTSYQVTITDQATGQVLSVTEQAAAAEGAVLMPLKESLPSDRPLNLDLKIKREGLVIEGQSVEFTVSSVFSGKLEIALQRDNTKIALVDVVGAGAGAALVFTDLAPVHSDVKTIYKISTSRQSGSGTVYMQDKSLDRATLVVQADGSYKVSFKDLGVNEKNLATHFQKGRQIEVSLEVFRTSSKFNKISLWKGKKLTIR